MAMERASAGPGGSGELGTISGAALDPALVDFWERGRAAWPTVALAAAELAEYLEALRPEEAPLGAWLSERRAADLFLACACARAVPRALGAFDAAYLSKIGLYLGSLRPTPELCADTRQELLEKLFVGGVDRAPKIRQYTGRGALEGWVRVTALRAALNLLDAARVGEPWLDEAGEVARAVAPGADPELELILARYKDEFVASFREAMASLSRRDRNVLRFTFIEGLTPARIGIVYGVHRTTAMRWVEAAQEAVLTGTRARLRERLRLSPSECDGIFAVVKSRIHVTLTTLLKTAS